MSTANILSSLATQINAEHTACEAAAHSALNHAMEAGRLLSKAKNAAGHGGWLKWIEDNCQCSARTAQTYLRLHENRATLEPKAQCSAHLSIAQAVKLLAPPRTALEELRDRTDQMGEAMPVWKQSLDGLRQRLDDADTAEELLRIIDEAQAIMNAAAESRLRGERAFGKLMEEISPSEWTEARGVMEAMARIRDKNLYRGTHATFEDYCRDRWGLSIEQLSIFAELEAA